MAARRTQIYLDDEQRRRLDAEVRRRGTSLASLIRDAVDAYLIIAPPDPDAALDATFGAAPGMVVPSRDEWARG